MAGEHSGGDTLYCPGCGEQNSATAQYCQRCGQQLPGMAGGGQGPSGQQHATQGQTPRQQPQSRQQTPRQQGQYQGGDSGLGLGDGVSRRQWILGGIVGTVLLGGIGIGATQLLKPTHRLATDDAVVSEDKSTSGQSVTITGELELPEGTYLYNEITPTGGIELEYELDLESSTAIDVLTMPVDQFSRYQDRNRDFAVIDELTERDVSDVVLTRTFDSEGEYRMVYDNTGFLGASPSGTASAEYTLEGGI